MRREAKEGEARRPRGLLRGEELRGRAKEGGERPRPQEARGERPRAQREQRRRRRRRGSA
jgi:hypothetical protein